MNRRKTEQSSNYIRDVKLVKNVNIGGFKVYETSLENADERYNKLKTQKDDLKSQLDTANTTIEDLKKNNKDNETLQNTIKEHETTIENLKKEAKTKDFNYALDSALKESKCKNNKALKALLDIDSIKYQDGKLDGLESQLETLKKDAEYLFELENTPSNTGGFGNFGRNNNNQTGGDSQSSFMDAIRNNQLRK